MSETETLRQQLLYAPKDGYDRLSETDRVRHGRLLPGLYALPGLPAKTEREAVTETIRMAEGAGFTAYTPGMRLKPGTKIYWNNRHKSVLFAVIGKRSLADGVHICAAHIDSPRLDLKPQPHV